MTRPDWIIAGGAVIGLAVALELRRRGAEVTVISREAPDSADKGGTASWAAAGMLAASDPINPPELAAFAKTSAAMYPAWLAALNEQQTGTILTAQTRLAWEESQSPDVRSGPAPLAPALRFRPVEELSVDPREVWKALHSACQAAGIQQVSATVTSVREFSGGVEAAHSAGRIQGAGWINCAGAWATKIAGSELSPDAIVPRKGQMLRLANTIGLRDVARSGHIYAVPRLDGTLLAGATVEDAGFDRTVLPQTTEWLRAQAARLVPALASAPILDAWTGFRPATPDGLPLLGQVSARGWVAGGHSRNGILLAPATAVLLAGMISGEKPAIPVDAFAPARFAAMRM